MSAEITQTTVISIEQQPNFRALLDEYAEESAIYGLPHPSARMEIYKKLETTGMLKVWSAMVDGVLVGLITVLTSVNPHYGISVSVSESFFVSKEYRKSGAGLKLLAAAEAHVDEIKSPGLLISAPIESILAEVLSERDNYTPTNMVFFRKTANV